MQQGVCLRLQQGVVGLLWGRGWDGVGFELGWRWQITDRSSRVSGGGGGDASDARDDATAAAAGGGGGGGGSGSGGGGVVGGSFPPTSNSQIESRTRSALHEALRYGEGLHCRDTGSDPSQPKADGSNLSQTAETVQVLQGYGHVGSNPTSVTAPLPRTVSSQSHPVEAGPGAGADGARTIFGPC